jgi:hypothetical protein
MPTVGFTEALLNDLDEAKTHDPYKRRRTIGPAVDGGWTSSGQPFYGGEKTPETIKGNSPRWDCSCSNYNCKCTEKKTGRKIAFGIDRAYKRAYNKRYRAWLRKQGKATQRKAA